MSKKLTLDNGVRVHLIPYAGTDAATVLVLCRVGSRYETLNISGASHFIEHMMFKGTTRRPTALDISKELDSVGSIYNAYTGKDLTGYYVKTAGEHVKFSLDLLYDMMFHSAYKPAEMKRETKVILEEIKMYEDNPLMHVENLLEEAMFEGNPLGRDIAGTIQTMKDMKRADVIAFRDSYYVPNRIVVAVAGKVPENVEELLSKTFGKIKNHKKEPDSYTPFGDLPARKSPRIKIQSKKTEQVQIMFGFPSAQMGHKDSVATSMLASILGGSMSSRLFIEIRERRGLAYVVQAGTSAYEDTGLLMIQIGLDRSKIGLATKTVMKELRSIVRDGVTAEETRRVKDYIKGKLLLSLENSSNRAEFYAKQELYLGKVKTPKEKLAEVNKVTAKQLQRLAAEIFDQQKLCIGAIGPFASEKVLLREMGM